MSIQIKGFLGTFLYIMLGLVSYMILGDYSVFMWVDPWVYIYMAFWPIIWLWNFIVWIVIIGAIIFAGVVLHEWWTNRK